MPTLAELFGAPQMPEEMGGYGMPAINIGAAPAPQPAAQFKRPKGFVNTLGKIADALSVLGDGEANYSNAIDAREQEFNAQQQMQQRQNILTQLGQNPNDPAAIAQAVGMGFGKEVEQLTGALPKPPSQGSMSDVQFTFRQLVDNGMEPRQALQQAFEMSQKPPAPGRPIATARGYMAPEDAIGQMPYRAPTAGGGGRSGGAASAAGPKVDPVRDRTFFAKTYTPWVVEGGRAEVDRRLQQLQTVRNALKADPSIVGGASGYMPDVARSVVNREGLTAQQLFEEVVQSNLRQVLGGQFAMKEGEGVLARAFDPKASAEDNIARLDRLMTQIQEAAAAKDRAAQYYEERGTVAGFQGMGGSSPAPAAAQGPTATGPNGEKVMWNGSAWVPAR